MTRFVTSLFLTVLVIDIASAAVATAHNETPEPPHGVRRMIEALDSKNKKRAYECEIEELKRSMAARNIGLDCRGRS